MDYAIWPLLFFAPLAAAVVLVDRGVSEVVATLVSVATLGLVAWILERVRPERREQTRPDQPVWMEAAHFFLGVELGYAIAMGLCELVHRALALSVWPVRWPLALQIIAAVVIYEGVSYWQHRLFHRSRRLWGFHALHHAGERLNLLRVGRFHVVDIAVPTFVGYLPLVLLGAPPVAITLLGVVISVFGVLQHANIRMRTPVWLDYVLCTPAMHRQHHARNRAVSECNYGTTVMIWDLVFGSYRRAIRPDGPEDIGIENDEVPRTFWRQILSPFSGGT